jgi:hypothetical protein
MIEENQKLYRSLLIFIHDTIRDYPLAICMVYVVRIVQISKRGNL